MPLNNLHIPQPNDVKSFTHPSVRRRWIQNLVDALHYCLLKGDIERAKKAWAILIRCREVDWKARWNWGLLVLSSSTTAPSDSTQNGYSYTQMSQFTQDYEGKEVERWLNSLRVSAREEDKPSLLNGLVLHFIKHGQYRRALDQLETYLSSYPFLRSGPLHTYAGLLSFYLAQPVSSRVEDQKPLAAADLDEEDANVGENGSSTASPAPDRDQGLQAADSMGLRISRAYFAKALELDVNDQVAQQFIRLIDNPLDRAQGDEESEPELDNSDEEMDEEMDDDGSDKSESHKGQSGSGGESENEDAGSEKLERFYDSESDGYASF
ncbi:hypothetical protein I317_00572 [Kwoniella heveanensis CBS 569]|nr:hypothetical protein I317_00572 [Kwoniella heveanensis CBS 569]